VRFDSWETLYPVGEPIAAVYIPEDCLVSVLSTTEAGKAVEVLSVGTNGMVGLNALLSDRPSPCWVQTTVGGVAWRVGLRDLRDLVENSPTLARSIYRAINTQTVEIAQSAACNRAHRLDGQIARWILTACDRTSSSQLRLSHEQIAERLAVRRASVSVAIESFVRDGLVKGSRGSLTVTNRGGLRAVACECFAAIESEWAAVAAAN
jgi:CRP-like cAMP-binding protein